MTRSSDRSGMAAQLSELAFKVTRKHATERASPTTTFRKNGPYRCICCDALCSTRTPSSTAARAGRRFIPRRPEMVGEKSDNSWFMRRTEVHCAPARRIWARFPTVLPNRPAVLHQRRAEVRPET